MIHGSLFSGIEGFALGAKWAGIKTKYSCEIEEFQRKVIQKNFSNIKQYDDIQKLYIRLYVDILSGGFPCQDISIAGKGVGIEGLRSGLWTEFYRIIRDTRPKYVLIENSPMLVVRGFERLLCDLAEIGYDAQWQCISNSDFGFPHKRERLYTFAYDTNKIRRTTIPFFAEITGEAKESWNREFSRINGDTFWGKDYPEFLRMDNGIPDNVHRLEAVGNAVNPFVAQYLFECVKLFDSIAA
jgi:DNA (cytosine-5)-methyltransferase 1